MKFAPLDTVVVSRETTEEIMAILAEARREGSNRGVKVDLG